MRANLSLGYMLRDVLALSSLAAQADHLPVVSRIRQFLHIGWSSSSHSN